MSAHVSLFHLPEDAARLVTSLLKQDGIEALTGVSAAARISPFQVIRDAQQSVLVLPPNDPARTRSLLSGLRSRSPLRLSQFQWIDVAAPWHIDLLAECGMPGNAYSIRVVPVHDKDIATTASVVTQICEKLRKLRFIQKLHLPDAAAVDISSLACMHQVQYFHLTCTLDDAASMVDLSFIRDMLELQTLIAINSTRSAHKIHIPPLCGLPKVQTITLRNCSIESAADLVAIAQNLKYFQLSGIQTRHYEPFAGSGDHTSPELASRIERLQAIGRTGSATSYCSSTHTPSLHSILQGLDTNPAASATLSQIRDVNLTLPGSYRLESDLDVLLQLPQLANLYVDFDGEDNELMRQSEEVLARVLVQLPPLEHLFYQMGTVPSDTALARLHHLKELTLFFCQPLESFDWIHPLRSLRCLTVFLVHDGCDFSGISSLPWLEELQIEDGTWACDDQDEMEFLKPLVNLRRLDLVARHIHDLDSLRDMKKLTTLSIKSTCLDLPTENVEVLHGLMQLRDLNIADTTIADVAPLLHLPKLRSVTIADTVDCTPLANADHPKLLRLLHARVSKGGPTSSCRNCLWSCKKRELHFNSSSHQIKETAHPY